MTPIAWHPAARRELFEASAFYAGESPGLGDLFLDAVEDATRRLATHPRSGPEIRVGTRRFLISRFPYSLVYRIDEHPGDRRLLVLAVAHQKRRPRYWEDRLSGE